MKFNLYSIYDRVSGEYGSIFMEKNDSLAIRKFNYLASNSKMVSADLELYVLGFFDTETGELVAENKPVFISKYSEVNDG